MKLIITEKAIAGKRISAILAGKQIPAGFVGKAQLFKFKRDGKELIVLPLRGHIVDVDFPKQYSYWIGTDLKKLSKATVEYIEKEKQIISALRKSAKGASGVIIATDADREGESIGVEAINFIKETNPKIKIERAYFSAITPKDIEDAFSNLKDVDYNLADSADSRREIDLIWGAVLTRFLSLVSGRLGKEFLSAGRVQTPTLAIIVDREKERTKFKSKKYWELKALFEKDKQKFEAQHKKGRFWEKEEAEKALGKKSDKGTVVRVESKKRIIPKPIPFNTTAFLRAATAIGFSAGEAMNSAEFLYQQGFTSYPRTDNSVYPPTIDLKEILNELKGNEEFSPLAEKILSQEKITPSKGKEAKDHPPIYPVTLAQKNQLSDRQWRIYELIVRRFLATLAEEAETMNQTVEIDLNGEPYIATGQLILKKGWKEFYPYSVLKEVILPKLEKGDLVNLIKLDLSEKETQPPARYSQSALIKFMEENGLGTKSTRHNILQKLLARRYITGLKAIEPNQIAFAVIDSLEKHAIDVTKPKMTAELEKEMDAIAVGKKTKKEVVDESRLFLEKILDELLENKNKIGSDLREALRADSIVGKCDKCNGDLRILFGRSGKRFLACNNYPKCTNTYPLPQKGRVVATDKLCEFCGKPMIKVFGRRYRYSMCVDHNCKSKEEWKKKAESKKEKKQE